MTNTPTTNLPSPASKTDVAEFNQTEAAIAELKQRYQGLVFDFSKKSALPEAKKARSELRSLRTGLESLREALKKPVLERGRQIDTEAKRITEQLLNLENPLAKQIELEEQRREKEKREAEERERMRIQRLQERMNQLRDIPVIATGWKAAQVLEKLAEIEASPIADDFDEFKDLAVLARQEVIDRLKSIGAAKQASEAEEARIRQQREELAREREDIEEQKRVLAAVALPSGNVTLKTATCGGPLTGLTAVPAINKPVAAPVVQIPVAVSPTTPAPNVAEQAAELRAAIVADLDTLNIDQLTDIAVLVKSLRNTPMVKVA